MPRACESRRRPAASQGTWSGHRGRRAPFLDATSPRVNAEGSLLPRSRSPPPPGVLPVLSVGETGRVPRGRRTGEQHRDGDGDGDSVLPVGARERPQPTPPARCSFLLKPHLRAATNATAAFSPGDMCPRLLSLRRVKKDHGLPRGKAAGDGSGVAADVPAAAPRIRIVSRPLPPCRRHGGRTSVTGNPATERRTPTRSRTPVPASSRPASSFPALRQSGDARSPRPTPW